MTDPARSFPFAEMKTRPAPVAAQSVPVSFALRAITETAPPRRSSPYTPGSGKLRVSVRAVAPVGPIRTKSPQAVLAAEVVNSGQIASSYSRSPPQPCVCHTLNEPWNIEPAFEAFGSAITGG